MSLSDLKNKTNKELTEILSELKAKLARLSFELGANTLKDTSQVKKTKKDIARVSTMIK